jgi:hypothetical protein
MCSGILLRAYTMNIVRQWLTREYSGRTTSCIGLPTHCHFGNAYSHTTRWGQTSGKSRMTLEQQPELHQKHWRHDSSMSSCLIQMRVMSILLLQDFVSLVSRTVPSLSCKKTPRRVRYQPNKLTCSPCVGRND